MEIFKLFGSIFIDNDEANKSIAKTEKGAESLGSKLGSGIKTAAKWGAGIAAGAAAAGTAVLALANKTAATADNIDKMSQKLGLSREAYQEWDFVMSQSGANIDSMQSGMKTLANQFDELGKGGKVATDAFGRLGITYDDLAGKSREEIFETTISALQNMENEAERAAIANDLLGRSGSELAPLLNAGAGAVEDMKQKARDLGLVLNDEAVDAGVNFTDTMDQLKRTFGALMNQAIAPILPVLNDLMQQFIQILPPLMEFIQPLIQKLVPVVQKITEALLPVFIKLLDALMPILDPLIDIFLLLVDTVLVPMIEFLTPLIEAILPIFTELLIALMPVLEPLLELFGVLLKELMPIMVDIFTWISDNVIPIFIKAIEKISPVIEKMGKVIGDIFGGIRDAFKTVVNFVIDGVNVLIRGLNKLKFDLPDWVPGIGGRGFGININEIPRLAAGGDIAQAGMAIVGERGPELLHLDRGARVEPLDDDREYVIHNYTILDGKTVSKTTSRIQAQKNRSKSRALGVATV